MVLADRNRAPRTSCAHAQWPVWPRKNHPVLKNGGRLEVAQQMAAYESARMTGRYDRRSDEVSLDEVERIGI
jgi:hypothetical protein